MEKEDTPGDPQNTDGSEKEGTKTNKDTSTVKTTRDALPKKNGKENPQSSKENPVMNQLALLAQEKQKLVEK